MTTERLGKSGGLESAPKPVTISERKLLNIIAAVGNHEAKALLLVLMQDDVIYTPQDLVTLLNGSQERKRGWKRRGRDLWGYCEQSFEQIGLVVQKPKLRDGGETVGYIKTEDGKKWGNIVAAGLLQLSIRHNLFSLADVFGETGSCSRIEVTQEGDIYRRRSAESRLKIYRALLESTLPIRQIDLLKSVGMEQSVAQKHLQSMHKLDLITYESGEFGKPFVFYQVAEELPKDEPDTYHAYKTMTGFVFGLLRNNPHARWTIEAVSERYIQTLGYRGKAAKPKYVRSTVSKVLKCLEQQGFVRHEKFSADTRSQISLSSGQRELVLDIVGTIDSVWRQDRQATREARDFVFYLRSHPEEVSNLMIKAREYSNAANKRPISETSETLAYLVSAYPGSDVNALRGLLEREGIKLGHTSVDRMLRNLAKAGGLRVEKVRGVNHYSVASS